MITKSGNLNKRKPVTQETVNSYDKLLNNKTVEQKMDDLWVESATPKVLPTAKPSINTTVKPINISQFVKSVEESNVGKQAKLNYQNDKLREQIEQKEKEYARANNISDWSKKNQEKSRIQQELNALNSQFDTNNQQIVSLSKPTLMTAEQVEKANKNAPLSQKIDKTLKWDIPRTAEKVGRTAMDTIGSISTGVTRGMEGYVDAGAGGIGTALSGLANLVGQKDLAKNISDKASKFVEYGFADDMQELVNEKSREGTGIYNPSVMGNDVRDIISEVSRTYSVSMTGGLPGLMVSASGGNIQEALKEGQSLPRATIYGGITGSFEGALEKLFDPAKIVGGGLKTIGKSFIGKLAEGTIGEGIEEGISRGLNPFIKMLTYEGEVENPFGSWENFLNYLKEIGKATKDGIVIGLFTLGVSAPSNVELQESFKDDVYNTVNKIQNLDAAKKNDMVNAILEGAKISNTTPARQIINQDLELFRDTGSYQRTQPLQTTLPKFSEIAGKKILDAQVANRNRLALPEPKMYASEQGEVINPDNYVAKERTKVPEQPNYSPVNSRQVFAGYQIPTAKTNAVYNTAKQLNVDTQLANRVMEMAKLVDVSVNGFVDVNENIDGYNKDGAIYINKNSEKPQDRIFVHELTHNLEKADGWQGLRDTIFNSNVLYNELAEKGQTLEEYRQLIKDTYAENGIELNEDDVDREVIAKFAEEHLLKDQKSIDRMVQENPTFMQRVKNFIDDLVVKFKGTAEEKELLRIQRMYDKAFAESKQVETPKAKNVQYDINYKNDMERLLQPYDTEKITNKQIRENVKNNVEDSQELLDYQKRINEFYKKHKSDFDTNAKYSQNVNSGIYDIDGNLVKLSTTEEGNTLYIDELYVEKQRQGTGTKVVDMLKKYANENNLKLETMKELSTAKGFWDKTLRKETTETQTDNQGRQLSKQQQEYFKDSKVRDEEGNLQVLYHGSNSEFTVFDISKSGRSNTNAGIGFWFTTDKKGATEFANQAWWGDKKQKTYETYLNIKNPKVFESFDNSNELDKISERLSEIKKMKEDIFWKDTYIFQNYRISQYTDEEYIDSLVEYNYSNKEKQNQMKKLIKEYVELSKEESLLDKKYENERYTDSYEQFRTEIYKLAGKDADFANSNNTGRYIENHEDLVKQYREKLIKEGYDGIIIKDTKYDNGIFETEHKTNTQYVAFEPNQIKNIDNTNPTENPDIRYSVETRGQATAPKKQTVVDNIAPKTEQNIEDLPQETQKVARVLTKAPKKDLDLSFETVSDMLMRKIVDAGNTINTIGKLSNDETLYPMYNNTKQARQSAEYMIGEKQTDITGTKIVGNSLVEIFKPVKAKGEEYTGKFYEYLLHMHNIDRMAQDKPVFGESVTAEISRQKADELLKENPEFEKLANKVYVYNRNLMQWRVDSGLISREQADIMNKMYPHYVPTFRDMSGTAGSKIVGNAVNIANTVRKATGGNRDILPLDLAMARQTMQTVQAAKRNLFGNRLLNDVLANQEKAAKYITAIEKSEDGLDVDEQSDASLSQPDNNTNVFKIYRDGKSFNMYVNSGIFEGLRAISSQVDATDTNKLLNALAKPNTMFKQLVTGMNPMFLIKNPIRDIQDATLYSKNLRKFLNNYPKTFKEQLENSADWQLYKALGGVGSSFFDYETGIDKTLNKSKLQRLSDNTLGRIEGLNMMTEQAPRFAEFKATIQRAGNRNYDTLMKAIYNAADVTVNFGRTGTITQVLNKTIVPFLNPSIQGASKTIRTLATTKGGSEWAKLVTKATLFGILPSVLNELIFGDDEEYENLNDRDKDTNFVFKYGDNKWIKIPKGRVISSLGNLANRGIRLVKGQEVNWGDYLSTLADQTAPISPLESNIFSPIKAIKDNKTWYGSDIVPQRLQQYEAKDQYDEKTDAFSKWLGGILNYSPKKINYLIDAYTGVIGDFALPLTTPTAEVNPFMKAFTIDGNFSNEIGNKFYETKDKYSKYKNNKPSAVVVSRYLNKQNDMVNDLHAEIRKIQSSDVTDAEKKAKSGELRELINLIESTAIMNVKEYEKAVEKYINKFPNNKERSEDYAYLMANKEMFGAEYAVKAYSTKKYNDNRKKNMNTVFNKIIKNYSKVKTPVAEQEKETLPTALDIPRKIK